jgi:peptidoglycan L-alanyl-D-glutamate endopeptidase CwlK
MNHYNWRLKMGYVLGSRSKSRLVGVHPDLVRVVERAIQITSQDFTVLEGLRTLATQRKYVAKGASKTMNSKHLRQPDGYSHAVDIVPIVAGKPRWEWPVIYPMAAAMAIAAKELGVELIWGGVWDRELDDLPKDAAGIKAAVNAYVDRRRAMGRSAFIDGPHFQLKR